MKTIYYLLFSFLLSFGYCHTASSQIREVSFGEIDSLQENENRNVVVFIHTDWCRFCQWMQNATFKNPEIVSLLNESFYFVSLDAETKEPIYFHGHNFLFKPTGNGTGVHELAEALAETDGKVTYPTICVLNNKKELIFQYNQVLTAKQLLPVLMKMR